MATSTLGRPPGVARSGGSRSYRKRRRLWPLVLIGVLLLALAGTAVWLIGFSPVLGTDRVEVRGAEAVAARDIERTAAVPLGLPLARQDIDAIAARVADLTPIESVEVTRQYPDTVLIVIKERAAVIGVADGGGYLLLDRHGVPYRSVKRLPAGVLLAEFNAGNTPLAEQLGVVAAALPGELTQQLDRLTATSESSIELELKNGDRVIWGTSDESALKAAVLLDLMKQKAKVYNVSAPRHPATR